MCAIACSFIWCQMYAIWNFLSICSFGMWSLVEVFQHAVLISCTYGMLARFCSQACIKIFEFLALAEWWCYNVNGKIFFPLVF